VIARRSASFHAFAGRTLPGKQPPCGRRPTARSRISPGCLRVSNTSFCHAAEVMLRRGYFHTGPGSTPRCLLSTWVVVLIRTLTCRQTVVIASETNRIDKTDRQRQREGGISDGPFVRFSGRLTRDLPTQSICMWRSFIYSVRRTAHAHVHSAASRVTSSIHHLILVPISPNSTSTICCGFAVVQFVFMTGLLTNISTILATLDDNFDVLAACSTTNVASAVAMLHLHTAATVCSF